MKTSHFLTLLCLFVLLLPSCGSTQTKTKEVVPSAVFESYWNQGKAELTSYTLEQARYGEVHKGHAVLIFVTEDFSSAKQVKLDNPQANIQDAVKVLKLNFTKKFNTGIYPYSMMQSVFTPVDYKKFPNTLKTSTSSQEWCGHSFTQINLKEKKYNILSQSYFESEGDQFYQTDAVVLEDEIWNIIRIHPEDLPVGEVRMIRGSLSSRLRHTPLKVENVEAKIVEGESTNVYKIYYPSEERSLAITYATKFPHEILSWEETYLSGWGSSAKKLTTKATLNKRLITDYWTKNKVKNTEMRSKLGLD